MDPELTFFKRKRREFCRVSSQERHDQRVLRTILDAGASSLDGLALCEDEGTANHLEFLCDARGLTIERHIEPPPKIRPSQKTLWFMAQAINTRRQLGEGGYLKECLPQ